MKKLPLIVLDRDGVINVESKAFIKSPEEWIAIPGSLDAIAKLNQRHFQVVVATNQSGVGRGLFNLETLHSIHDKMLQELAAHRAHLAGIYFCPHLPENHCACRKPKPGLLKQIAKDFNIDLKNTIVIGDSWRDIEAGLAVGAQCILVLTGNGNETRKQHSHELNAVVIKQDLTDAINYIINQYSTLSSY